MTGVVKAFNPQKGFGFVSIDGRKSSDAFCHYSDIVGEGYRSLRVGTRVSFDVEVTSKGARARNVQITHD